PTNITQIQSQQSVSLVQQRFLAASLLDPFASREFDCKDNVIGDAVDVVIVVGVVDEVDTTIKSFGFSTPFGSSSTTTTATTGFAAPTNITQIQSQQSVSLVQQRFLAASLLDPFASREFDCKDNV
ncbi:unnamed protein product, partial [Rotaria sp. Silwood1]